MSKSFDLDAARCQLMSDTGIARSLAADFEKMKSGGGLWGSARNFVAHAIRGIIVGLDQETQTLLTKATQWFSAAIEFKEPSWGFPPNYCQSCQYGSLALCRWLSSGEADEESLAKAVEYRNNYFIEKPRELYDPVSLGQL